MSLEIDRKEASGLVRPMERHDLAVVGGLIARLARHHGDKPHVDLAGLEADMFGPAPWLHGLVVERFCFVVGYALMIPRYRAQSTQRGLDLHHLFVLEGSRGLGLGRKLVEGVVDFAREAGCGFVVVRTRPENSGAQAFYAGAGFTPRGAEGPGYALALDGDALKMPA